MRIKMRYTKILAWAALLYPLIEAIWSFFTKGESNNVFRVGFFVCIIMPYYIKCCKKSRYFILAIMILLETIVGIICGFFSPELVLFITFIITLRVYSQENVRNSLSDILNKCADKTIYLIICIYTAIVLYMYFAGTGSVNKWGTVCITGPYSLPHIIAYVYSLWFICIVNIFINSLPTINFKSGIASIVTLVMILLTGVRSVLLAIAIYLFARYTTLSTKEKIILFFSASCILIVLFRFTNVFSVIVEKTIFAETNSTLSNGRIQIWLSSLKSLGSSNFIQIIFGHGREYLLSFNQRNIGMSIQAHNDFITVLVSYGILGLAIYIYCFVNFVKQSDKPMILSIFLIILAFTNGMFEYTSFVYGSLLLGIISSSKRKTDNKAKYILDKIIDTHAIIDHEFYKKISNKG